MNDQIAELQTLIDSLTLNSNIHICIHDISGLHNNEILKISSENKIHSKEFCNSAKATANGMRLCLKCKILANKKSVECKKLFISKCPLGITEIVLPVVVNGNVMSIIYLGNIMEDYDYFKSKVKKACKITGVNENNIFKNIESLCITNDLDSYIKMVRLIQSYIILIYNKFSLSLNSNTHWAVDAFKNYASSYYNKQLSLKHLAKLYYLNENYIGRIFKKQEGKTFSEFVNDIRIDEACRLLKNTDDTVINIALKVGFNNVTYFNRVFKKSKNMTPNEYRLFKNGL